MVVTASLLLHLTDCKWFVVLIFILCPWHGLILPKCAEVKGQLLGLERGLGEHWKLFKKTWVLLPAPTWWLITPVTAVPQDPVLPGLSTFRTHTYMLAKYSFVN